MSERGPYLPEIRMESPHYDNNHQWRWKVVDSFGKIFASGESADHDVAYPAAINKLKEVRSTEGFDDLNPPESADIS